VDVVTPYDELSHSTNAFCRGEPGSMKLRPARLKRHRPPRASAVISAQLSVRFSLGPVPALADDLVEHSAMKPSPKESADPR